MIWLVQLVTNYLIYLATNIPKQSCSPSLTQSCAGTLSATLACSHSSKFQTSQTQSTSRSVSTAWRPRLITRFLISTVSSDTIFTLIFGPLLIQLHSTFLNPPFSLMLIFAMFFLLCLSHSRTDNKNTIQLVQLSLNNSSTGLPTFRNSPVVVPPQPDPVLEPPPLPPNAPTTQSSRLPGHGAQVGVCPPHEDPWLLQGSSLVPQQDHPNC